MIRRPSRDTAFQTQYVKQTVRSLVESLASKRSAPFASFPEDRADPVLLAHPLLSMTTWRASTSESTDCIIVIPNFGVDDETQYNAISLRLGLDKDVSVTGTAGFKRVERVYAAVTVDRYGVATEEDKDEENANVTLTIPSSTSSQPSAGAGKPTPPRYAMDEGVDGEEVDYGDFDAVASARAAGLDGYGAAEALSTSGDGLTETVSLCRKAVLAHFVYRVDETKYNPADTSSGAGKEGGGQKKGCFTLKTTTTTPLGATEIKETTFRRAIVQGVKAPNDELTLEWKTTRTVVNEPPFKNVFTAQGLSTSEYRWLRIVFFKLSGSLLFMTFLNGVPHQTTYVPLSVVPIEGDVVALRLNWRGDSRGEDSCLVCNNAYAGHYKLTDAELMLAGLECKSQLEARMFDPHKVKLSDVPRTLFAHDILPLLVDVGAYGDVEMNRADGTAIVTLKGPNARFVVQSKKSVTYVGMDTKTIRMKLSNVTKVV